MLLIAEIVLTILAWNKGWKWLSLIPVGVALAIGVIIGASGGTDFSSYIWVDILAVVALIVMLFNPKK